MPRFRSALRLGAGARSPALVAAAFAALAACTPDVASTEDAGSTSPSSSITTTSSSATTASTGQGGAATSGATTGAGGASSSASTGTMGGFVPFCAPGDDFDGYVDDSDFVMFGEGAMGPWTETSIAKADVRWESGRIRIAPAGTAALLRKEATKILEPSGPMCAWTAQLDDATGTVTFGFMSGAEMAGIRLSSGVFEVFGYAQPVSPPLPLTLGVVLGSGGFVYALYSPDAGTTWHRFFPETGAAVPANVGTTPSFGMIGEGGSLAHWDTFDLRPIPNPLPN